MPGVRMMCTAPDAFAPSLDSFALPTYIRWTGSNCAKLQAMRDCGRFNIEESGGLCALLLYPIS